MVHRASYQPIKVFATRSTKHLLKSLSVAKGDFDSKLFSDGELYLKLLEEVNEKEVWVLANTFYPAENLLELFFLLDALSHAGAKIKLMMSYFGYARQDKPKHNEVHSGELIAKWIQAFHLNRVYIIHMHSSRLLHALNYENLIPFPLYVSLANNFDAIVAPDKGAIPFVEEVARLSGKPLVLIEKHRPKHEVVKILSIQGEVKNKRLLIIDDMISTGNTILEASKLLYKDGAKYIEVMATHGLFVNGALKRLEKSKIGKVYVTNTLPQMQKSKKLRVFNLGKFLQGQFDLFS